MDKDKFFDYLSFQMEQKYKVISLGYLNILADSLKENGIITPEKFQIIRKRVLDTMNDSIRESKTSMDKAKEIFN
jgi:TPP-dependent pyruvate/acetoin dehydrogenase alpha subunit